MEYLINGVILFTAIAAQVPMLVGLGAMFNKLFKRPY